MHNRILTFFVLNDVTVMFHQQKAPEAAVVSAKQHKQGCNTSHVQNAVIMHGKGNRSVAEACGVSAGSNHGQSK